MGSTSSSDSDSDRRRYSWYDFDSDDSSRSYQRSPSPPPKRQKVELKYDEENGDDDEDAEIQTASYKTSGIYGPLNIKYCDWSIPEFSYSDLFKKKGYIRSNVYRAGDYNEFQFYFVIEKLETEDDTHFGVYVCVLSKDVTVNYKSYIVELRGHKYQLNSSKFQKFPRKTGFRFLGSLSKDRIMDDDYWSFRYLPEDVLTLCFKINVCFKYVKPNTLEKLLEDNKVKDITLVVKGEEFRANKVILKERSPFFAKLLDKDKKAKKLEINNVDPHIMKQLLLFMYTGYVTKLFTYADKISVAADKYKLKDLKAMCKKVC